jgi:MFS family permease
MTAEAPRAGETAASAGSWPRPKGAYWAVFLLVLSLTSLQIDTNIVPYVLARIKADLHLSDTNVGVLMGASFGLFYALVGVPMAWLIDRYSRKWIIVAGIITWSLGTALCGMAQSYAQLFVARFIVGAGEAGNGPASYSLLADLFPREKLQRAVASMQLGSVIGPAVALLMSAFVLQAFLGMKPIHVPWGLLRGWQLVLVIVGLPGFLVALLLSLSLPKVARHAIPGQVEGREQASGPFAVIGDFGIAIGYMARHWRVFAPMFGALLVGALRIGAQQWIPIFYQRTFHWAPPNVAKVQGVIQLAVVPLCLWIGVTIAERLIRNGRSDAAIRVQILGYLVALIGTFFTLMPNAWASFAVYAFSLAAIGLSAPAQNAALQTVCPAAMRGKITALFLFLFNVVGLALSPIVIGWITDHVFHSEAMIRWSIFAPLIVLNPLAVLVTWLALKPYGREVERLKTLEAGAS